MNEKNDNFDRSTPRISLNKPANIRVIIPGGDVVEVTIGIALLAGEIAGVIARIYIEHLPQQKRQATRSVWADRHLPAWLPYADTVKFQSLSILQYFPLYIARSKIQH